MFKTNGSGSRQIHLRVPEAVHRQLKIVAAMRDQTVNEMVADRVIRTLLDEIEGKCGQGERAAQE